jgi:hypothetical protein
VKQKIISFELPEDSIYRLTKKKAVKDSFYINEGDAVCGQLLSNPVKLDQRCMVSETFSRSISTSWVKDIKVDKTNPRKLIIKTENSVYELEEVDDQSNSKKA